MANNIEYVDIVSKAVGNTYELVDILSIYCWQYEKKEKRAAYFLPRLSFNNNKEYLEKLYPDISKEEDALKGKGVFTEIWKIAKFYNKVSILNPEEALYNDPVTLSAFKAWVEKDNDLKMKKEKGEEIFLQVYALENKSTFANYRYSSLQNTAATVYYDWSEILNDAQEIEGK